MHRKPRWASDAYNDEPASVTEGVRTRARRHAAVFEELRRQVRVHSPQLSKLLGKVWLGEDELVKKLSIEADKVHDTIVSSQKERHELVKQSKKALSMVETAIVRRQVRASCIRKATLREREAECASNKSLVESLNEELGALREQVGKYVEGHVDDIGDRYEALKAERMKLMTEEDPATGEAYPLAEIERLAKNPTRRLRDERRSGRDPGEVPTVPRLTQTWSRDLTGLVASVDPGDFGVSKSYKLKKKPSTEVGCQHVTIKVEGVRVNKSLPPPRVEEPTEEGLTMPLLLRKQMCEFPPSQRIPSLQATLRLILSLYLGEAHV